MKSLVIPVLLLTWVIGSAQPSTEVYLFELSKAGLANPVNISQNPGYDNQPSFWPDNRSLLYARTVNGQTEIARYWIKTGQTDIITRTFQGGEYSPTAIPNTQAISAIRLDTTGLQLLYRYDLEGSSVPIHPSLKIGYHAWIHPDQLVAFVLGDTFTLQQIHVPSGEVVILRDSIGRSLHKMPHLDAISFVDKAVTPWSIKKMDLKTGDVSNLVELNGSEEDYAWLPDGTLIMGKGNILQTFNKTSGWKPFADLSAHDLSGTITRLAVSSDGKWLAVVIGD